MRISDWSSDVCSSDLPCRRRDRTDLTLGAGAAVLGVGEVEVAGVDLDVGRPRHRRVGEGAQVARQIVDLGGDAADVAAARGGVVAVGAAPGELRRDVGIEVGGARGGCEDPQGALRSLRSEAHTSEIQSLMRILYAV